MLEESTIHERKEEEQQLEKMRKQKEMLAEKLRSQQEKELFNRERVST